MSCGCQRHACTTAFNIKIVNLYQRRINRLVWKFILKVRLDDVYGRDENGLERFKWHWITQKTNSSFLNDTFLRTNHILRLYCYLFWSIYYFTLIWAVFFFFLSKLILSLDVLTAGYFVIGYFGFGCFDRPPHRWWLLLQFYDHVRA